jgi:DNA-binding CsgD family transcriptional regulator
LLQQSKNKVYLTEREKDVLREIMNEKSIKEIAKTLFISEKTVEHHRANLFIKLEVKNSTGLVKKTMEMRLLD